MTGKIVLLLGGILAVQSLYITSVPITNWGNYLDPVECPTGSFVTSFKLRTESYRGQAVDDTALNDIEIRCTNPTTKRVVFTGKSLSPHGMCKVIYVRVSYTYILILDGKLFLKL